MTGSQDGGKYDIDHGTIFVSTPLKSFIGRSISSLNKRTKYGVDVLSIKSKEKRGDKITAIPSPKYVISEEDTLVVAGEIKNINHLKTLD